MQEFFQKMTILNIINGNQLIILTDTFQRFNAILDKLFIRLETILNQTTRTCKRFYQHLKLFLFT